MTAAFKTLLDRYDLFDTLGEGGFGTVYAARDRTTGRRLALKALTRRSPHALSRFKQEFRAVQEVHHPNLVRLEALLEDSGQWLIAMELVEGIDLLRHVRRDGEASHDPERLVEAFRQLAHGLAALHAAGYVHRDLKPSNVRVTAEGRVVLLDFGLATSLDPANDAEELAGFGTVVYMAPEQASEGAVSSKADWYAFGVCLYEAITGALPISAATGLELITLKRELRPVPPSAYVSTLGRELEALCMGLLEPNPAARFGAEEVFAVLEPERRDSFLPRRFTAPPGNASFAGRTGELAQLEDVLAEVRNFAPRLVLVEGESGIGKSGLVAEFLRTLQGREPGAFVLRARCYENEQLAYKAFDGAMDDLAQKLKRLEPRALEALLPPRAGLLCRVFPVLGSVPALAQAPLKGVPRDPSAQRLEAFRALFRLLEKLSEKRLVVLSVDDLQWADAESFRLLEQLFDDPHPPALLVLATVRPREELEGDVARSVLSLRARSEARTVAVEGLPPDAARGLARQLVHDASDTWIDGLARESRGHPLFLTVLARHAEAHDPNHRHEPSLAQALDTRLADLAPSARALLEVVAVSGAPQGMDVFARAAGLPDVDMPNLVSELCGLKLLRPRKMVELACFHDQIRAAVLRGMPPEAQRAAHARLARVLLEREGTDPVVLAGHFDAAGDAARALHAYRRAAERALDLLAFGHAAALYGRALALAAEVAADRALVLDLSTMRGHALARAGRSVEAARQYLAAQEVARDEEKTRLALWAAQHFLQGAALEEGLKVAIDLVDEVGLSLPRTPGAAMRQWLWHSFVGAVRGMPAQAPRRELDRDDRMRLEAAWGLALPLAWLDPLRGSSLSFQHLRLALTLGDPLHVARSLAIEAQRKAITDPRNQTAVRALFERARIVSHEVDGDPSLGAFLTSREGSAASFCMDLRAARSLLEEAERLSNEQCPDEPWLLTNTRIGLGAAWANTGEHAQLAQHAERWIAEACERDDRFALAAHEGLGYAAFRHLIADRPDEAAASLDAAMAPWPREPFSFVHYGAFVAAAQIQLYRGGQSCLALFESEAERHGRAILLRAGFGKPIAQMFRVLALCAAHGEAERPEARVQLLREARALVRSLARVDSPFAHSSVPMLEAQLAALEGRTDEALAATRRTRTRSELQHRFFLFHTATYLEGCLEGGDGGAEKRRLALAFFAAQGWRDARRACFVLSPASAQLVAR